MEFCALGLILLGFSQISMLIIIPSICSTVDLEMTLICMMCKFFEECGYPWMYFPRVNFDFLTLESGFLLLIEYHLYSF